MARYVLASESNLCNVTLLCRRVILKGRLLLFRELTPVPHLFEKYTVLGHKQNES